MQASANSTVLWVPFKDAQCSTLHAQYKWRHRALSDCPVPGAVLFPSFQWLYVAGTVVIPSFRKSRCTERSLAQGETLGSAGAQNQPRSWALTPEHLTIMLHDSSLYSYTEFFTPSVMFLISVFDFLNLLMWHWDHKSTYISSVQFCDISSVCYIVCSPPEVISSSVTILSPFALYYPRPLPSPLLTTVLLSVSVSFCCVCLYCLFVLSLLYPTYEQNHMVLNFFCLTDFA